MDSPCIAHMLQEKPSEPSRMLRSGTESAAHPKRSGLLLRQEQTDRLGQET